jgi:predicted transcriptional regulator
MICQSWSISSKPILSAGNLKSFGYLKLTFSDQVMEILVFTMRIDSRRLPMEMQCLPPRERQVAEAVYRLVEASSAEIRREVGNGVSISSVKTMLERLEAKKVVSRRKSQGSVFYSPAVLTERVRQAAVERMTHQYFDGSIDQLMRCCSSLHHVNSQAGRRPSIDSGQSARP